MFIREAWYHLTLADMFPQHCCGVHLPLTPPPPLLTIGCMKMMLLFTLAASLSASAQTQTFSTSAGE